MLLTTAKGAIAWLAFGAFGRLQASLKNIIYEQAVTEQERMRDAGKGLPNFKTFESLPGCVDI